MFLKSLLFSTLIILVSACGGGASGGGAAPSYSNSSSPSADPEPKSTPNTDPASSPTPSNNSSAVDSKAVLLQWQRPEQRENGEYMEGDEIGGYELRYKKLDSDEYSHLVLEDGWLESYEFKEQQLAGAYEFQIAVFDTNGLYSEFVDLQTL